MLTLNDYRESFDAYARDLLWIANIQREVQRFTMNNIQQKINSKFDHRIRKGRCFLYILKARQQGASTYSEGRVFHSAHLWPNTRAAIVTDEIERSEQIFKMTKMFYERLPSEWRPMTRYSNKRELIFENPSKHGRYENPGLNSSIEVFTAGSANVGRGWTFNVCHLSEFAFYPNGPNIIDALMPSIHNVPGNFVILETTADMAGSFAHDEWIRYKAEYAKHGEDCELLPYFSGWFDLPSYSKAFADEDLKKQFVRTYDDEELALIKRFNLTPEQLYWRREQIRIMKGDLDSFRREYPSDDEEAWLFAGIPVFNRTALTRAWQTLPDRIWVGEISSEGNLRRETNGRLHIFKKPEPDRRYIVAVDPSGGSVDEACIQVIDAETLEQCAEWVGVVSGIELATYVWPIGLAYGGTDGQALLAIELTGGWGISTMNELQGKYWNFYKWPRFDTANQPDSNKVNWETNVRTKPLLVDFGQFCFNDGYAKVNSAGLLKQMSTFVRDSGVAASGQNHAPDDRVMAWLIGTFVAGSGRSDLIRVGPKIDVPKIVLDDKERFCKQFFGATLETQCDLDYMYGVDADGYEDKARDWRGM
jgi:hypothetical protein